MQIFLNNNIEVLIVKKLCLRKINDATRFYENVKTKSLEEISDWLTRAEGTMAPTFRYTRLLLLKDGYNVRKVEYPNYDSESSALVKMYLRGEFGEKATDVDPYIASTFFSVDRYASFKTEWEEFYKL